MNPALELEGHSQVTAQYLRRLIMRAFRSAFAMRYCMIAQRDEKNGFPFAAALQWRKAAELFDPMASTADRCWIEWERIMHLPRHLARRII